MGRLSEHEFEDTRCAECRQHEPVGPCASCESMICGDCGVLNTDPAGKKCICLSCARLISATRSNRLERRPLGAKAIAALLLLAFGVAAATVLLR